MRDRIAWNILSAQIADIGFNCTEDTEVIDNIHLVKFETNTSVDIALISFQLFKILEAL